MKDVTDLDGELQAAGAKTLLTAKEAAGFARCDYITLWRAIQKRELQAMRRGRRLLVRRSELARWLCRGAA